MGILTRFSRTKYDDSRIAARAQIAVDEDPLLKGAPELHVVCKNGVVTISGVVHKAPEKDRVEGDIRSTLRDAGLKYDRIENEIVVH